MHVIADHPFGIDLEATYDTFRGQGKNKLEPLEAIFSRKFSVGQHPYLTTDGVHRFCRRTFGNLQVLW